MGANIDENLRHEKMQAEIAKIFTEIEKMRKETMLYPLVVGSGATLAIVAIAKLFL